MSEKKQRVVVFKLYSGYYLKRDGSRTNDPTNAAAKFRTEDAYRLLAALRPIDRGDPLWGVSLEMLEKRRNDVPLSEDDFREFLVTMKTVRLIAKADKYDRDADGYIIQAKHAEQMAAKLREQAAALRQTLETK
jgi:hypothetical protein